MKYITIYYIPTLIIHAQTCLTWTDTTKKLSSPSNAEKVRKRDFGPIHMKGKRNQKW